MRNGASQESRRSNQKSHPHPWTVSFASRLCKCVEIRQVLCLLHMPTELPCPAQQTQWYGLFFRSKSGQKNAFDTKQIKLETPARFRKPPGRPLPLPLPLPVRHTPQLKHLVLAFPSCCLSCICHLLKLIFPSRSTFALSCTNPRLVFPVSSVLNLCLDFEFLHFNSHDSDFVVLHVPQLHTSSPLRVAFRGWLATPLLFRRVHTSHHLQPERRHPVFSVKRPCPAVHSASCCC